MRPNCRSRKSVEDFVGRDFVSELEVGNLHLSHGVDGSRQRSIHGRRLSAPPQVPSRGPQRSQDLRPVEPLPGAMLAKAHGGRLNIHRTAIASISIIQSGCASAEISTSVDAGPFLPRNSSRSGARSARYIMSVT